MKFLILCFLFHFCMINAAFSQHSKDVDYFGKIGNDSMSRSSAEETVKNYYAKKLKNTTRHVVILPKKADNIINVDIVELDGSIFHHVDIDRTTGRIVGDDRHLRQEKIRNDNSKRIQANEDRKKLINHNSVEKPHLEDDPVAVKTHAPAPGTPVSGRRMMRYRPSSNAYQPPSAPPPPPPPSADEPYVPSQTRPSRLRYR